MTVLIIIYIKPYQQIRDPEWPVKLLAHGISTPLIGGEPQEQGVTVKIRIYMLIMTLNLIIDQFLPETSEIVGKDLLPCFKIFITLFYETSGLRPSIS